jgi:hypothetical protein
MNNHFPGPWTIASPAEISIHGDFVLYVVLNVLPYFRSNPVSMLSTQITEDHNEDENQNCLK